MQSGREGDAYPSSNQRRLLISVNRMIALVVNHMLTSVCIVNGDVANGEPHLNLARIRYRASHTTDCWFPTQTPYLPTDMISVFGLHALV
jgi:hypothetical protein